MKNSVKLLTELIEPTVEALGLQLWGIEHVPSGQYSLLRIYLDSAEGIGIEDCEKVSRQVSAILDVEDPIPGEYTLEVSSPGMDRPLFTAEQFASYVGSQVRLKLRTGVEGRRKFRGVLTEVTGQRLVVAIDDEHFDIDHSDVEKANLIY